jgi:hypothetical protein
MARWIEQLEVASFQRVGQNTSAAVLRTLAAWGMAWSSLEQRKRTHDRIHKTQAVSEELRSSNPTVCRFKRLFAQPDQPAKRTILPHLSAQAEFGRSPPSPGRKRLRVH